MGATFSLIETKDGKVFGGYTSIKICSDNKFCIDNDAFIFSFQNKKCIKVIPQSKVIGCF